MSKTCKHCGRALVRKDYGYRVESMKDFRKRPYCNMSCYDLYRHAHRVRPQRTGLTQAEAQIARDERHQARQTRPHTGFHLNLVREWLQEWR